MRSIFIFLVSGLFVFGMSELSLAMMCGEHSGRKHLTQAHSEHEHGTTEAVKEAGLSEKAVNVGNKICPVSGEKIDQNSKATYEYEGKIYNFCCASCVDEFQKDPEKYIETVEEELQAESKEESKHEGREMEMMQGSGTSHQRMHEGHQH